jgi:tetratricopeptide (TPR) repeat protein
VVAAPPLERRGTGTLLPVFILILLTIVVFSPVAGHEFTSWDDELTIARNPRFNPPTVAGALYYWRHPHMQLYVPVTYSVWALVAAVATRTAPGGAYAILEPAAFHLVNLALHLASVVLVFGLLRRLVSNPLAALAGGLLFAVHPVQVEAVAWVSGTKDLLCGLLSLLALWHYLAFADPHARQSPRRALHYGLGSAAFILAMLSKPGAMVVPGLAAVLDVLILRRPWKQSVRALAPWFGLAVACAILTALVQPARGGAEAAPLWSRPLVAADAVAFYLYKLVVPLWLGIDYGRTPRWILDHGAAFLTWIAPAALGGLLWWKRATWPVVVAGAALFVIGVSPVLGLVPFSFQHYSTVADHYLYLPMFGVALALASLCSRLPTRRLATWGGLIGVLLATQAWAQSRYWHDTFSLFEHALEINPRSAGASKSLAAAYVTAGDPGRAVTLGRQAVELDPNDSEAQVTLGAALVSHGQPELALPFYRRATELAPEDAQPFSSLAALLAMLDRAEEALPYARRAVAANPDLGEAHLSLGSILALLHRPNEAEAELRRALEIDPGDVRAHSNLGSVLADMNRRDEARVSYQTALRIDPAFGQARAGLAALDQPAAPAER